MDAKKELPKVFRFDNAASTPPSPKSATMRNLIFSGPNKGKKMNSGNGAYDILNFSDNCISLPTCRKAITGLKK